MVAATTMGDGGEQRKRIHDLGEFARKQVMKSRR
jgi:hypothetical protein